MCVYIFTWSYVYFQVYGCRHTFKYCYRHIFLCGYTLFMSHQEQRNQPWTVYTHSHDHKYILRYMVVGIYFNIVIGIFLCGYTLFMYCIKKYAYRYTSICSRLILLILTIMCACIGKNAHVNNNHFSTPPWNRSTKKIKSKKKIELSYRFHSKCWDNTYFWKLYEFTQKVDFSSFSSCALFSWKKDMDMTSKIWVVRDHNVPQAIVIQFKAVEGKRK